MHKSYPQEILIQYFSSELHVRPFWTYKFGQNERYYSKQFSAQLLWNRLTEFREIFSYEVHNVLMYISTGNFDSLFSLGIMPILNLEIWPKWNILLKQFVSATPLKLLNRTSRHSVVMKDLMCRCAYLIQFLFLGVMPLFEPRNLTKIKSTTQNNSSEQLHWNRSTKFL